MFVTVTKENESVIYNGIIYSHGQSFDADEAICKSLIERGFVEATVSKEEKIDEAEHITGYLDEKQLQEMSYPDLKRLASQMGVSANGKKDELIARICAEEVSAEVEEEVEEEIAYEETSDDLPNTSMPE